MAGAIAVTSAPGVVRHAGRVTVVVASRNRRDQLLATLPRHEGPVVLVDNASTDRSADAVAAGLPDVDVVRLSRNIGAAARTVGVHRAGTPYVAFADDDSWWEPGSLSRAVALLDAHPRTALLAARVLVGDEARTDPVSEAMATAPLGTAAGAPGPAVLGFLACSVIIRRDAYLSVGGFAPLLHVYGEEALLALDLAAAGWRLAYADELVVHHHPSEAGRAPLARRQQEHRNALLTAVLRRRPAVVAATATRLLRTPDGRAALRASVPLLPAACVHRRRLPPPVEAAATVLERT